MRADSPAIRLVLDRAYESRENADRHDAWQRYATEILDHSGVSCEVSNQVDDLDSARVVIFADATTVASDQVDHLRDWVTLGGAIIAVGDPGELSVLTGTTANDGEADVETGHVEFVEHNLWTDKPDVALHAVGGVRLTIAADDVQAVGLWDGESAPAITVRRLGAGVVVAIGVDVWRTIVRIQQGSPVHADGEPAPDGTAPLNDDLLKCEDGLALCFDADRAVPPGQPEISPPFQHVLPPEGAAPMFHRPHADMWRSVLQQCIWWASDQVAAPIAWLYYWPSGVPAVAHMSHDSDENHDDHGRAALDSFAEANVRVTWCHVFPGGYSPEIYAAITAAGHEQALHYNAMADADIAQWGWPYLRAQHAWAQAITGTDQIVSNKNHYTRWEGYTEFYQWCEQLGIEIDESRGPSKQGTIGFPFGTTHVSFPMADGENVDRFHDVLSLPLHTQDLALAAHESVRDVILDNALRQHGIAHFLFHGKHLFLRADTRKACVELAAEARRRGMQWWTAAEINRWERLRRGVQVNVTLDARGWRVTSQSESAVPNAAILLTVPGEQPTSIVGDAGTISSAVRHGREFIELDVDIPPGRAEWLLR